jgi:ABC-type lipoprotein release transport system permease subunit
MTTYALARRTQEIAAWVPARQAAHVDPLSALRAE